MRTLLIRLRGLNVNLFTAASHQQGSYVEVIYLYHKINV